MPSQNRAGQLSVHTLGHSTRSISDLGGLRQPEPDSQNTAWQNEGFQGYADHMQTQAFQESLDELIAIARQDRIAIMCAEAVPWRCHRSLLADALTVRDVMVDHILSPSSVHEHELTDFARVEGVRVTYPGESETEP